MSHGILIPKSCNASMFIPSRNVLLRPYVFVNVYTSRTIKKTICKMQKRNVKLQKRNFGQKVNLHISK